MVSGAQAMLATLWRGLGGADGDLARVTITGNRALPSPFAVTDLAAASIGAAGLAVSELIATTGAPAPPLTVDRTMASGWFRLPVGPSERVAGPPKTVHATPWMTEFATADERWLRLQATFPTLRRRVAEALGVAPTPEAFAEVIRGGTADAVEAQLIAAGAAVAANRSIAEWRAHPQGQAVAQEPIRHFDERTPPASPEPGWSPDPARPLAGIRVLDMTRVIAGPIATRFLASCGAEVLRLDAPGSDESSGMMGQGSDLMLGKRWAFLDLRAPGGRDRFLELVAKADVLVHGYRPGSLEALGILRAMLEEARPDLVEVRLNAYGWTGPWRERRGFDTLVQFSTGICDATSAWALEDPQRRLPLMVLGHAMDASRPRHLPVEAIDFGTAYQLAAAALRGLTHRVQTGRGSITHLSLAKTAQILIDTGFVAAQAPITLPLDGPYDPLIRASPRGAVRQLAQPVAIQGCPLFWERPYEAAGASAPVWSVE